MSFLVVLVVDDVDDCPAVLKAWEDAGVKGVTILPSSGLGRARRIGLMDNLPLMPSLQDIDRSEEIQHRTLFSVVEDQQTVDKLIAATQQVIGNLDEPHTGFLFVVPVLQAFGLWRQRGT
jgi:nitrogen regulatory protein PII